jgi:hypothetical protein
VGLLSHRPARRGCPRRAKGATIQPGKASAGTARPESCRGRRTPPPSEDGAHRPPPGGGFCEPGRSARHHPVRAPRPRLPLARPPDPPPWADHGRHAARCPRDSSSSTSTHGSAGREDVGNAPSVDFPAMDPTRRPRAASARRAASPWHARNGQAAGQGPHGHLFPSVRSLTLSMGVWQGPLGLAVGRQPGPSNEFRQRPPWT